MAEPCKVRIGSKFPQHDTVAKRLETFKNWPSSCSLQPTELTKAGFFYQGDGDSVACFCCGGILSQWEHGDNAWTEHEKFYPMCAYVLLQKMGDKMLGHLESYESFSKQNSGNGQKTDFDDLTSLEERIRQLQHESLCKTCLEEKACIVFLPCSHISACIDCAKKLQHCNICQKVIKATVRAYCS